jgi:uncharacterized PurR-regulated membrane protein YhhQ (DUF165 family)
LIQRIVSMAAAVASIAAAAGVCVVALSYALYAVMREWLTPAGSAAVVAAVFALLAVLIALVALRKARPKPQPEASPVERLVELARQKPLIAAAGIIGASFIAVRNPGMVATLVMGLMAPKPDPRGRRR